MTPFRFIRRHLIRKRPFPKNWLQILQHRVPYYEFLPDLMKSELQKHLPVLLHEKHFEGCGGLKMTEEIEIIIAAYAAILVLGDPAGYYPSLHAILVYPDDYVAPVHEESESGIMTEGVESRSGESWNLGSIVLSWRDIQRDIHQPLDGRNLIFHEFAHQLDDQYGVSAGIDESGLVHSPNEWNRVLADSYLDLRSAVKHQKQTLLDSYGATHPAEFFAVATEAFFEKGHLMKQQKPRLYDIMVKFFHVDPAAFLP